MYLHSETNSSDLLWVKSSDYIITQKKIGSVINYYIESSKDSKLMKFAPIFDNKDSGNNFENTISIDLDDLLKIDLENEVSILNFYNKYGDIGLLSHQVKGFITAPRWLPTHELSPKSSVVSITPYQSESFFDVSWKKRLKPVGAPLAIDKEVFPDMTKGYDSGIGEYNSEMKKLLGSLVRDNNGELLGDVPGVVFEDHLQFSQLMFDENLGDFMGRYFPDLVTSINDDDSQFVDFPLPYSVDYFKNYAEPLSEVKKVLRELKNSFDFSKSIDQVSVLPKRPSFYMDENTAKSFYGRETILQYLPKLSISPVKKSDSIGCRWKNSCIFKSLLSMFALKMRQELVD
tara:strand:+ start:121 stop:1155 length:1035 start_codon:yes stop_codon:yes gene_type:complete